MYGLAPAPEGSLAKGGQLEGVRARPERQQLWATRGLGHMPTSAAHGIHEVGS